MDKKSKKFFALNQIVILIMAIFAFSYAFGSEVGVVEAQELEGLCEGGAACPVHSLCGRRENIWGRIPKSIAFCPCRNRNWLWTCCHRTFGYRTFRTFRTNRHWD